MSQSAGDREYERQANPARSGDRDLLLRWKHGRDRAARDEVVRRYLPLAKRLARRWQRPNESADDLIQVASLALVKAVDRFDPEHDASLASYAVPTILGELKRYFRDRGWAVRVPRDLQELAMRVERAAEELSRVSGTSPTPREIAKRLGITIEDVIEAQEAASAYRAVPLEHPGEAGDDDSDRERRDANLSHEESGYRRVEERALLGALFDVLTPREREVLRLRFVQDLTQSEIGDRIGVSQMHVSRILRSALMKMQEAAGSPE